MGNLFDYKEPDYESSSFGDEVQASMAEYTFYTAYDRTVPSIVDGLKPVHRRILFGAVVSMGQKPTDKTVKCATIVGEVMGKFHPHGDAAIYDSLVRMISPAYTRYNLFYEHQGNFGDPNFGDSAAAQRYTETVINHMGASFLSNHEVLPKELNYDRTREEPTFLCPSIPTYFLNDSLGIGSGISGKIPGHNVTNVCEVAELILTNPTCSDEDIVNTLKGPDHPAGGNIVDTPQNRAALSRLYSTGKATLYFEASWKLADSDLAEWSDLLIVTGFCPGMTRNSIVEDNYLQTMISKGLITILDESSGTEDIEIRIYAKSPNTLLRDVIPQLGGFHKHYDMLAIDFIPTLDEESGEVVYTKRIINANIRYAVGRWFKFRQDILRDQYSLDIWRLEQDRWKIELQHMLATQEDVFTKLRNCSSQEELDALLYDELKLSEEQAAYILRIRLSTILKLNQANLLEQIDAIDEKIKALQYKTENLKEVILEQIREYRAKYGDRRKTTVFEQQELPVKEDINYLVTAKTIDESMLVNDSWPQNGVGLNRTASAMVASDSIYYVDYQNKLNCVAAEDATGVDLYVHGFGNENSHLMGMVNDEGGVDFRWIPDDISRSIKVANGTLKHAMGIPEGAGAFIDLNGNGWSYLSWENLQEFSTERTRKFWDYWWSDTEFATRIFPVTNMDDIVDKSGNPVNFNKEAQDLHIESQGFVVSDYNLVFLKSGRLTYLDKSTVFARWDTIRDIIPLGSKPLTK